MQHALQTREGKLARLVSADVLDVRLRGCLRQGAPAMQPRKANVAEANLHSAPWHQVEHLRPHSITV